MATKINIKYGEKSNLSNLTQSDGTLYVATKENDRAELYVDLNDKRYLISESLQTDDSLNSDSINPIQNKVVSDTFSTQEGKIENLEQAVSSLNNDIKNNYYLNTGGLISGNVNVSGSISSTETITAAKGFKGNADSATTATSATKATQDGNGKVISSTYETKTDASAKLTEAKSYADSAAKSIAESKSTVTASTINGNIKIDDTETTVYEHPTSAGNKHIPTGGSSGKVLIWSSSGSAKWGTDKDTTYSLNSGDSNGTIKVTPSSGSAYNVAVKGLGSVAYTDTVPVANGGTGATTAAAARTKLGITPANIGAAPAYTYGTTDLTAGTSSLTTGTLYFVYE